MNYHTRLSLKQGMGNPGIGESRTDKTGILVCLLENAFATLFRIDTDDEHTVYTADQLS